VKVTEKRVKRDAERFDEVIIEIRTPDLEEAEKFMMMQGDEIEIRKKRQKRSLDANAYLWELCDKIASKIKSTKEEVYREAVRDVGTFDYLMIQDKAVDKFIESWELKGVGYICMKHHKAAIPDCTVVQAFYGSSSYSTAEMSRLIDYIVQEAKEQGIETSPDEERRLLALWKNH